MIRDRKRLLLYAALGAAALYLLRFPEQCAQSVRDGITLCTQRIVPALFPYLVLSGLFLSSGGAQAMGKCAGAWTRRVFRVGGSGAAALMLGLTGGYPVGARTAAALCRDGIIEKREAQQLLLFCNNAGPAFLFGVVGSACYHSPAVGAALYGVHLLSALLCGLILRGKEAQEEIAGDAKPLPPFSEALLSSVTNAGRALLTISLLVTVFTVVVGAIRAMFPGSETLQVLLTAVLELSSGCVAVSASALPWPAKLSLIAAAVAWGGVCVHLQTAAAVKSAGLSMRPYLLAKALQAALSALAALPLSPLLEPVAQTFGSDTVLRPFSPLPWTLFSIGMTCLIFLQFTTSNSEENRL